MTMVFQWSLARVAREVLMRRLLPPRLARNTPNTGRSEGSAPAKLVTTIQGKVRMTIMKIAVMLSAISAGFALLAANASAQSASGQTSKGLTLRGRVESVRVKQIDESSALIEIKLKME